MYLGYLELVAQEEHNDFIFKISSSKIFFCLKHHFQENQV